MKEAINGCAASKNSPIDIDDTGGVKQTGTSSSTTPPSASSRPTSSPPKIAKLIQVVFDRDPLKLPWKYSGINLVIEGTIISNAYSTIDCLAPFVKVLDKKFDSDCNFIVS